MGILDEAIRQHLELKRKHGAAEHDLKRLEDEAFGPPSRPGEPDFPEAAEDGERTVLEAEDEPEAGAAEEATEAEPFEEHPVEEHPLVEPPPEEPRTEEADVEPEADAGEEGAEAASAEDEGADRPAGFYDQAGEGLDLGELDLELGEDEALVADELAAELEEDEPEELDSPEVADSAGEDEAGDDDVLADTPDFLRDAPEDDELWFEQGEPKDFDFEDEE